jgi:MFS family permease
MSAGAPRRFSLPHLLRSRPAFRGFVVLRAADELASQMLNVAIGWYVYGATRDPMSLAYVGLAQFLPTLGLVLIGGHFADRFDRARIIGLAQFVQMACVATFGAWFAVEPPSTAPIYVLLFVMGVTRAFSSPAMSATLPHLVEPEEFPQAVAAASSVFQVFAIAGPAIGGLVYAFSADALFIATTMLYALALLAARTLAQGPRKMVAEKSSEAGDGSVLAGVRYVRSNRLLLALISLDLFAVLLGGVTALLPIYARDILLVGPFGLGWLRCAPGIGAAVVGFALAHRRIERGAGRLMLACVAGFGAATVLFALSTSFWLSLAALAVAGGFDMVSMVIRQTLVQLSTPDAMRGRVSAVNWVFIGASNELGEFESGVTAALFGTVPAAVLGGIGTLIVVALWAGMFPELRRADKLVSKRTEFAAGEGKGVASTPR